MRSARAFSLAEVLVALAVAAIALLALLQLHVRNLKLADAAEATMQATLIAQEKMAETLAGGCPAPGAESGTEQRNAMQFAWRTEVVDAQPVVLSSTGQSKVRRVCVDVTWGPGGGGRSIRMATYATQTD